MNLPVRAFGAFAVEVAFLGPSDFKFGVIDIHTWILACGFGGIHLTDKKKNLDWLPTKDSYSRFHKNDRQQMPTDALLSYAFESHVRSI